MILIKKHLPKDTKILDVGCGTSHLLSRLLEKGYDAYGVDSEIRGSASRHLVKQGKIWIGDFHNFENNNRYNMIIFSEVLEHIENYISFLQKGISMLTPQGFMLISVPNYWTAQITTCPKCCTIFPAAGHLHKFKPEFLRKDLEHFFSSVYLTEYFHPLWRKLPLRYISGLPKLNYLLGRFFARFSKRTHLWIVAVASDIVRADPSISPSAEYYEQSKEYFDVQQLFHNREKVE